jgi:hypothetical protein
MFQVLETDDGKGMPLLRLSMVYIHNIYNAYIIRKGLY